MNRVDANAVAERGTFHRDRLGKQPHTALGRAVAGEGLPAAQSCQRRHHDDGAAAALAHRRKAMLDGKKHAIEVDRSLPPPIFQCHFDNRRRADADAGIGDEDIEPAVAFDDLSYHFGPARFAGDVLMPKGSLAAGLLDADNQFRTAEVIDIGHRHRGAFTRQ
jgi:hypothetical protein